MALHRQTLVAALAASNKSQAILSQEHDVDKGTVSRWFSGTSEPQTLADLMRLAKALKVHPLQIVDFGDQTDLSDELQLMRNFRALNVDDRRILLRLAFAMKPNADQ